MRSGIRRLVVVGVAAAVLVGGTAIAQTQRFSDVPADHPQADAIAWAAEVGLTAGYEDGTFRPDEPLPRWAALVFMERFYDQVLQAGESDAFTRGDMMVLLNTINDGSTSGPSASELRIVGTWFSDSGVIYYIRVAWSGIEGADRCRLELLRDGRETGESAYAMATGPFAGGINGDEATFEFLADFDTGAAPDYDAYRIVCS